MRGIRTALWLVLIASIMASTIIDRRASTVPTLAATPDGFLVAEADFHVHAFLGDGALPPWDLAREARRRGLDVIAVTNHNQNYALRLHGALFSPPLHPIVIPGIEVTTPDYHLAAIGVTRPIDWRLSLPDAIRAIHAQGGIAIGAHPVNRFWDGVQPDALFLIDALEVAHPAGSDAEWRRALDAVYARARQIKPTIAPIGSSDYHFGAPMGAWRTRVLVRELSIAGVLEAVRAGRTVAYDPEGRVFGEQKWIDAVAAAPNRARAGDNGAQHTAMAGAWLALAFLLLFRR